MFLYSYADIKMSVVMTDDTIRKTMVVEVQFLKYFDIITKNH